MSRMQPTMEEWQIMETYCPVCFVRQREWCRGKESDRFEPHLHGARAKIVGLPPGVRR